MVVDLDRGNRNRKKRTDLKSEKNFHTNPNPKDRGPTWAFLTASGTATARKEDRGAAHGRRTGQNTEPRFTSVNTEPRGKEHPTVTGHHHAAPRRWRAQPWASTHAGERARGGANFPRQAAMGSSCCWCSCAPLR
jgi:hypothetical protein